jgi:hypothetical protein
LAALENKVGIGTALEREEALHGVQKQLQATKVL